jgi:hypothetical protein
LISGAKSGANFSFKACSNLVKRVEVVILLPRLKKQKPTQLSGFIFGGPLGPKFELF